MKINEILFAGHSAVILKGDEATIAIDPWLEGNPLCPDNLKNPDKLDYIVLTHGHADHASDTVRLAKATGATVLATFELAMLLADEGVSQDNLLPMNKGGTIHFKDFSISLTQAFHSSSFDTHSGETRYAGEPCGVVVKAANTSIYHAGDTCLFSDMQLIKEEYNPKIALLPIGDCFTMGPSEAAIAAQYTGCKLAIPIHFNTFEALTGTAQEFSEACKGLGIEAKELQPGESFKL